MESTTNSNELNNERDNDGSDSGDDINRWFQFNFNAFNLNSDDEREIEPVQEELLLPNDTESDVYCSMKLLKTALNDLFDDLNKMTLKDNDRNQVFSLCENIVNVFGFGVKKICTESKILSISEVVDVATDFVRSNINKFRSRYRRDRLFESNPLYVAPQEKMLGTRWEMKRNKKTNVATPYIVPNKMQFIPLTTQLRTLFLSDDFRNEYFKFNNEHNCTQGDYRFFCCGKTYQNNELFKSNPDSLQIQIATDDFEIVSELQSKAGVHKTCAVYFTLKNMPPKYLCKLSNIFVVILCNANDLKSKTTDFNDIWSLVVEDLSILENEGIDIGDGKRLRGTLIYASFDNLGANTSLGLAEGFNASHYCKLCNSSKLECQTATTDDLSVHRTKQEYQQQLEIIELSDKVDYKQTFGIKRYCQLNDLKFYHMLDNPSFDPLHDFEEGIIPNLLKNIFDFCIASKVFTEVELKNLVEGFDYGYLNRLSIPTKMCIKKHSFGLTAAQIKCLFLNIPFILLKFREHPVVQKIWICMETLLQIREIVYSYSVSENDIIKLEYLIDTHFKSIINILKVKLLPKHHFVLHYPFVFRSMGPLVYMSMIRFEAKHKSLKHMAKNTNNYVNIHKTLAVKHQQSLCTHGTQFNDRIKFHKKLPLSEESINKYNDLIDFPLNENSYEIGKLFYNTFVYMSEIIIEADNALMQINKILFLNSEFFFVCVKLEILGYHAFSNSLEIKLSAPFQFKLIKFDDLKIKTSHEARNIENKFYIPVETIELKNKMLYLNN
jgi:hypothetical protein